MTQPKQVEYKKTQLNNLPTGLASNHHLQVGFPSSNP